MTKPLLASLLFLSLSVSAGDEARLLTDEEARAVLEELWRGELDGKALICENKGKAIRFGVEFKLSQVIHYATRIKGTRAVIEELDSNEGETYKTTPKTAHWWNTYTLNRATLALKYREIIRGNVYEADYDCELADSPEAMLKTMEAARLEMQREIDEEMSNNKI